MTPDEQQQLEEIMTRAMIKAMDGDLTDAERVAVLRFALNLSAEEFYRVEKETGEVRPDVMLAIQQLYLLCEDDVTPAVLLESLGQFVEDMLEEADAQETQDSGSGVEDAG